MFFLLFRDSFERNKIATRLKSGKRYFTERRAYFADIPGKCYSWVLVLVLARKPRPTCKLPWQPSVATVCGLLVVSMPRANQSHNRNLGVAIAEGRSAEVPQARQVIPRNKHAVAHIR